MPPCSVEAPVLDCDRRLAHPGAHLAQAHRLTVLLGGNRAEQGAVGRVDERIGADRRRPKVPQIAVGLDRARAAEADRGEHGEDPEEHDKERAELAATSCSSSVPALAPMVRHVRARTAGSTVAGRLAHSRLCSRRRRATRRRRSLCTPSSSEASGAQANRDRRGAVEPRDEHVSAGIAGCLRLQQVDHRIEILVERYLDRHLSELLPTDDGGVENRIRGQLLVRNHETLVVGCLDERVGESDFLDDSLDVVDRDRSPSRSGWVNAITIPATKLASGRWAARPTTRPTIAEEARSPAAIARTWGRRGARRGRRRR